MIELFLSDVVQETTVILFKIKLLKIFVPRREEGKFDVKKIRDISELLEIKGIFSRSKKVICRLLRARLAYSIITYFY